MKRDEDKEIKLVNTLLDLNRNPLKSLILEYMFVSGHEWISIEHLLKETTTKKNEICRTNAEVYSILNRLLDDKLIEKRTSHSLHFRLSSNGIASIRANRLINRNLLLPTVKMLSVNCKDFSNINNNIREKYNSILNELISEFPNKA